MSLTREETKKALETLAETASTIALELSRATHDTQNPVRSDQARGLRKLASRLAAFVERSSMTSEPYDLEIAELVKQAISPVTLASLIDPQGGISIEALLKDSYSESRPQVNHLLTRLSEGYTTGVDREILLQDPQPTQQFFQPVQLQTPTDLELELQHVYNVINDTAHCKLAHKSHLRQFDLRLQPLELEAFNAELIFNVHPVCSESEGVCLHETEIRVTMDSSNTENHGSQAYSPCSGIVEAHGKRLNLSLVIDDTLAHEAPTLFTGASTSSLRDLVAGKTAGQAFSSFVDKITPYDEISLAYILTKSIWQLYSTDWLNRPWTANDIHFYDSQEHLNYSRGGDVDLLQTYHPYVHVSLPQSRMEIAAMAPPGSRIDYSDEESKWRGRSFPDVLALGVLLIEVLWKSKVLPQKKDSSAPIHGNLAKYRTMALAIITESFPGDRQSLVEESFRDILQKIFHNKLFQGEDQRGDNGRAIRRDILFRSLLEPIRRLYEVGVKGRINRNGQLAVVRSSECGPGKATTDFDYGMLLSQFEKGCANRKSHTKIAVGNQGPDPDRGTRHGLRPLWEIFHPQRQL
ncbi:hypothetical protein BKA56DRAFT_115992 [Ilyonectria sp. MPI-CAGE-AT-0026]|nr:hypothetical protein BKA56DRAFT_115992 [Ilyonectria sp. MPI-CAGE-AT-0026]